MDSWDERCKFIFGVDARRDLVKVANEVGDWQWERLEKRPAKPVKTQPRRRAQNVKQEVVKKRRFKKITTVSEHVVLMTYRPKKCRKT